MMIHKFLVRMFRAAKLDTSLYKEVKIDTTANRQAFVVVLLVSLVSGIGAGIAGIFQWAGEWSIWLLLLGLINSFIVWFALSFLVYLTGTRILNYRQTSVTYTTMLRTIGFASSPLLLGFFLFIPIIGIYLWIIILIWVLIAEVTAVRQVLDFSIVRAGVNCMIGWFSCLLIGIVVLILISAIFVDGNYLVFGDFDNQVNSTVKPHRFSITAWEIKTIPHELSQRITNRDKVSIEMNDLVVTFFSNPDERSKMLENTVELILEKQVEEVLIDLGIYRFPPVNLKLDVMPDLLVVSPRNRIESIREIMLNHDMTIQEIIDIESSIDDLDVSSLVVKIGGFGGTYPSFVSNDASLHHTVSTIVEEWVHQYMAFKPLGFRYMLDLLGVARDYEVATMNETVAGMVSDEITTIILNRYYPEYNLPDDQPSEFDLEMRTIRRTVDDYLANSHIKQAEEYMENKRQQLVLKGYHIRKLNQAYFAWHGTYADEPSSVSPIGIELRRLRDQYDSISEFLDVVSDMTSRNDLKEKVELIK